MLFLVIDDRIAITVLHLGVRCILLSCVHIRTHTILNRKNVVLCKTAKDGYRGGMQPPTSICAIFKHNTCIIGAEQVVMCAASAGFIFG